nr:Mur ligase domain-containing protein [Paenibacillus larvae]
MMNRSLTQIARMAGGTLRVNQEHADAISIQGVSIDTRSLRPGNLFVPLPGNHIDGHEHVAAALSKEAAAAFGKGAIPIHPKMRFLFLLMIRLKLFRGFHGSIGSSAGQKLLESQEATGKRPPRTLWPRCWELRTGCIKHKET